MNKQDLISMFGYFQTDEERMDAVVDLGRSLKDQPKKGFNCVTGCASKVDLDITYNANGTKTIMADSDSIIVKGLLVLLKTFYAEKSNESVFDFLEKLGLNNILSTQRQNGLKTIIERIEGS
ncbi:MAG: SufE family protein [Alphaproteobacteria bacterium]|nr:SufE family protein [Alphaproteobacteria bacterium]MBN2779440.1 SufE family protein [Alphaproteobacteria bacterium]